MRKPSQFLPLTILVLGIAVGLQPGVEAQVRPVYDRGATGLLQTLKRLNTPASALMIGAHPDDEDTALLAYLARGENARTAYLSLTRGDGGQNIIGPELGEALGVIRTEELLQARRLDGAEQFFTRAYDYGFSKTLDEAKSKWNEKIILCDVVRVIRNFRPLVVISQFSGTPADGHGQHQFAGYITPLAVKAAADASQCTDAGAVWQVKKFYVRHRGQGEPSLRINTGKYDPLLGRSYFEIAMEARSQHKSQEQGVLELRGDQFSSLRREGSDARESSIFEGLEIGGQTKRFDQNDSNVLLRQLVEAYPSSDRQHLIAEAIAAVTGLQIDALAESETVVPGEAFGVGVKAYVRDDAVRVNEISLAARIAPERWSIVSEELPKTNSAAFVLREVTPHARYFRVTPDPGVWPTQPYWLIKPRAGDLFRWEDFPEYETGPFEKGPLVARIKVEVLGREIVFERDAQYRFADDVRGEIRRNVDVVPRVTLEPGQPLIVVPASSKLQTRKISFTVTNNSATPAKGKPSIAFDTAGNAWRGTAGTPEIAFQRRGETTQLTFDITIPANTRPGRYSVIGDVLVDGKYYGTSMQTVAYPHIQTHRFYRAAKVEFQVIDLKTTRTKVGYIEGSGDQVSEAIKQMGFEIETIDADDLTRGDLSRFDTIVVGIRAYQVRPEVGANNQRLLDYVRNGGTLIVQYQLPPYGQTYAPFPAAQGPRVADEHARVAIVDALHPVFNFPNKISETDFSGWVQERNLYNFNNLRPEYTGLLESHDAGEAENTGGLVAAKLGKGNYIYCSYSLFRQLPAGVSGAYRLFSNILSLPHARQR
jgi:LmbE family N-acetylglucosaminyl deacetylase